ncbi:MAG: PaaI family thioesterase [Chlorobi bacterium]|nr:PaaI family thioesterase [Chlorobiota bacterium]
MEIKSFQEFYAEDFSHCYGCGTNNERGYHIKTYWDGNETVSKFKPKPYHTALPGYVYGGLLASLIDCHSTGTGSAALYGNLPDEEKGEYYPRCVTASLKVDFLKPTPIDCELELRGKIKELKGRKVIVEVDLFAKGEICVKGEVVVLQVPDDWRPK